MAVGCLALWCVACGDADVVRSERPELSEHPEHSERSELAARSFDVFLISLDTFRKDTVGVYRHERAAGVDSARASYTPELDAFARDAVLVDGARSPMPFTLAAHMSLLTSTAPRVHGVSRGDRVLSYELGTLPEWLRAAGYATHGVAVNYWMKGDFGFARGFDSYQLVREGLISSGRVNAALVEILDRVAAAPAGARDAPLFVFAQYFDAHSASSLLRQNTLPYYSSPEYRADLSGSMTSTGSTGSTGPTRSTGSQDRDFCDAESECSTAFLVAADASGRSVAPAALERLRGLYDRSAAQQDALLGEFLGELKRRGLYDDALVIVTADHGEEFREHGRFLHSQTYEETIAVPLLVKLPAGIAAGRAGQRVSGLAMLEDIAPTILELLGLPLPETAQGVSLLPLILRGEPVRSQALSQDKSRRSRHALVADGYKLIYDFADRSAELYDLANDRAEVRDLSREEPQRTAALQRRLAAQVVENTRLAERLRARRQRALLSDRERESLRALGYLAAPGDEESRAD